MKYILCNVIKFLLFIPFIVIDFILLIWYVISGRINKQNDWCNYYLTDWLFDF